MQVGLSGMVFIVFLVLKLTGYIGWSWVWVMSPIWLSLSLVIFLGLMVAICTNIVK